MIRRLFSSQLRINMVSGVAATMVNVVVLAIAYSVYLHYLGYEKYGVWLVLATVLSFAQLGNLGIGRAIMKLVAEEHGRDNMEGIQQYVATAIAMLIISGTFGLILILAFREWIVAAFKLTGDNAQMVLWLLPYIGCLSIYVFVVQVLSAALSGLGRMDLAHWTQSAGRIAAVTIASFLLYSGHGIESLLIGNTLSYVLIHIVSLVFIWRIARIRFLKIDNLSIRCCKRLLSFGLGLCGGSLIGMLLSPFNKLILSRYAGVSVVPVYEIAFNGSMQVRSLFEAGLRAIMPEISRIGANTAGNAKERITQIYRRAMKLIFLFGIPMYGAIIILLTPLLKFWLKQSFVDELPGAFRIMLISSFVSLLSVPSYYTLIGLGKVHCAFVSHVILSGVSALIILGMVINLYSISVEAVSWAILTATSLTTLYLVWQNKRRLKLFHRK